MPDPLGVAVIGTGSIAEAHLYSYQKAESLARLLAVVDIDEARARRAADTFGVPDVYSGYTDVLARPDIHAVSICTPPFNHVEIAAASLRAGKHVLCEKPVAPTLAGLDSIAEAQSASGCVFAGVFQLRFGRGAQQLRMLADEGRLGRIHLGIAETLWYRPDAYYAVPWRGTWEQECGGVTVSQAIHLVDGLNYFLGEPVGVFARAGVFRAPIEADDTAVAVVTYANGAIGQITSTVNAVGPERSRLEIYGTELSAVSAGSAYDCTAEPFEIGAAEPSRATAIQHELDERLPRAPRLLHRGTVEDFLTAAIEGRAPSVSIEECRRALNVTAGIYKSAMTGEYVPLPIATDDPWYSQLPPPGFRLDGAKEHQ
jgi:predicted dehydrogenase